MKKERIDPMLATLVKGPVEAPGWVFEEKYDGIRVVAYRRGPHARLMSRSGRDLTSEFPEIAASVERLPEGGLVLDGEVVAFDGRGVSRFQLLQRRALGARIRPVYAVFDCLEAGGRSLLSVPLDERRRQLEQILAERSGPLLLARRLEGSGLEAYEDACRKGWEGILAKEAAAPYEPGRRAASWLKVKCRKQSEFVIGGFTAPGGQRTDFGALLVGLYDEDRLRFTGKVGTGFSQATLTALGTAMRDLQIAEPAFDPAPHADAAIWIRPRLVAQLSFAEWTRDGKLRQPTFLGLRHDKKPRECTWEERET